MMPSEASSTEPEAAELRARLRRLEAELVAARERETKLQESQARYRILAEDSLAGVYVLQDHKFAYVNKPAAALFGAEPQDLIGQDFTPFMLPETAPLVEENIRRRLAGEISSARYTFRIRTVQGEIRDIEVLGTIATFDGRPAIIGTALDRTGDVAARNALQEQTRLLELILECMGDGVAVANPKGEFVIFNPAGIRITGVGPTDAPPAAWGDAYGIFLPDRTTPFAAGDLPLARALRGESTDGVDMYLRNRSRPDGAWLRVTGRPLVDDDGQMHGGVVVFHDTTDLRHTIEKLERAEAKYRALVEQLPVITYTASAEPMGTILYVSPQIETVLGVAPAEWVANPNLWLGHLHPEDSDRVVAEVRHAWESHQRFVSEYRMITRAGDVVWFHDEAVVLHDLQGNASLLQGVMLDVTERETERRGRKRLQALSADLVAVQEAERRRLGLELHDDIGQVLTGLKMMLNAALASPGPELLARVGDAERLVDEATQRVRELSQRLRPAALDDLGLLPALVSHVRSYERQTKIQVEFEHRGIERRRFAPDVETAAYRIVQEALTNVARHAQVRAVRVRAWAEAGHLAVLVEDQGVGFDAALAEVDGATRGLGGLRERAALLGGQVLIETAPGLGCRVHVELPLVDFVDWR